MASHFVPRTYCLYSRKHIDEIEQLQRLNSHQRMAMKAVSAVLPFRVNNYVIEELVDWDNVPDDPIYQMTFPQPEMLGQRDFMRMMDLVHRDAGRDEVKAAAREIQLKLNPHPAGQRQLNVPRLEGELVEGMQHKYRETVLFFPSQGQTCHAYCSYCFRWPQFVGIDELKFASREAEVLVSYLRAHPEVSSVLITGGDPMIMKTAVLRRYVEPLLEIESVRSVRIGTKALSYWPYRFVTDDDADDFLRLVEQVRAAGKHLALMAHYTHPRELSTPIAQEALRRVIVAGAVVRCQAPLIKHVNDDADTWADMWRAEVRLGAVPYYMFIERDTGPHAYFEVPLAAAYRIFTGAYRQVSGLARTVRGPSMSTSPGKVAVQGVSSMNGEDVLTLAFLQARDPSWVNKPFFARLDPSATWLDDLEPAFGAEQFFWEPRYRQIVEARAAEGTPEPLAVIG